MSRTSQLLASTKARFSGVLSKNGQPGQPSSHILSL